MGRISPAAVLAAVAAGAALLAASGTRDVDARRLPTASLPWQAVRANGSPLALRGGRHEVLYVLPSCRHCDSAVMTFVRARPRAGVERTVVAGSGAAKAEAYRRRFALSAIGIDSAAVFARAAGIRLVPSLVTVTDSLAVVTPVPSAHWLRRRLAERR